MSGIARLRGQLRVDARDRIRPAAAQVERLEGECVRLEDAARAVLDGSGGGVEAEVARQLQNARKALRKARSALDQAYRHVGDYERSL